METNWQSYPPHSLWSGLCCNLFMDRLSSPAPERSPSLLAYQHLTDLSFCTQTAQSSFNISNYYHQSRLSLSSACNPYPSCFASCCQNPSTASYFRPISSLPTAPDSRPFWYPYSLDSYSGHYGNGLYRLLPSLSQASLPPSSPGSDYPTFLGATSLLHHYSPFSAKNSRISCSPESSLLSSSSLSNTIIPTAEPLTIQVKSEPLGNFSSPSIQSMTPEMSPQNLVKSGTDLTRASSIFSRSIDNQDVLKHSALSISKSNEEHKLTQDRSSKSNSENKTFRKFDAKVKPLQKDETSFNHFQKCGPKSEATRAHSLLEIISKSDPQIVKTNSLKLSKPLDTAIEVIPCSITSEFESSLKGKLVLDSQKNSNSFDSAYSDSNKSVKSKSNKLLSSIRPHSSKLSKNIYSSPSSSASLSDNLSSSVPVGIAVARKRQSSSFSNKNEASLNKSFNREKPNSNNLESTIDVISKSSNENSKITTDSVQINTAAITITPDYQLARDDITGQLFLFPTASNYYPGQVTSVITNSALSLPPPLSSSLSQSSTLNSESAVTVSNSYHQDSNLPLEDVPKNTVVEQAIQACMSDEESDHLVVNENPDSNICNKVTSACQVDMDADIKDDSKCLNIDSNTSKSSNTSIIDHTTLFEDENQKIPTLPVRSKELINFINDRGFDLLVEGIERVSGDALKNTSLLSDSSCGKNKRKVSLEVDLVDHNSASYTDGLKLLSALAEQRALEKEEEEESLQESQKRKLSSDCQTFVESKKIKIETVKRKQNEKEKSLLSEKSFSDNFKKESPSSPIFVKKRKKDNTELNPWMIRRSERIFLHEAYQKPISFNQLEKNEESSIKSYSSSSLSSLNSSPSSPSSSINTKKAQNDVYTKKSLSLKKFENKKLTKSELKDKNNQSVDQFKLTEKDLKNDLQILIKKDDLFYAGSVKAVEPPDIYGVTFVGQRNPNRNIYSREDLLKEAIKEIKPLSLSEVNEGKRVCAYWSQQYKCLYSGTIARCSSPQPLAQKNLIFIEFDDGDKGKISLEDIRLLPQNFPIQKSDKLKRQKQALKDSTLKNSLKSSEKAEVEKKKEKLSGDLNKFEKSSDDEEKEYIENKKKKEKEKKFENLKVNNKKSLKNSKVKVLRFNKKRQTKVDEKPKQENKKIKIQNKNLTKVQEDKVKNGINKITSKNDAKEKMNKKEKNNAPKPDSISSKEKLINFEKRKVPERQLWRWSGRCIEKQGMKSRAKKILYQEIKRGKESIKIGDCAVFLSTGRPHLPYVGRIDSMWQSQHGNMVVKVKWFYHPEETKTQPSLIDLRGALFESRHFDQNDVQTISHKCNVLSWFEYQKQLKEKPQYSESENSPPKIYYLAGDYEPLSGKIHLAAGIPVQDV